MRSFRTLAAGIAAAIALVMTVFVAGSPADAAPSPASVTAGHTTAVKGAVKGSPVAPRRDAGYGAIALSIDGAYGYSKHYRSSKAAIRAAESQCKKHSDYPGKCTWLGWVRNQCSAAWFKVKPSGVVDTKPGNKPRFAYARSINVAVRKARNGHKGGHVIRNCSN